MSQRKDLNPSSCHWTQKQVLQHPCSQYTTMPIEKQLYSSETKKIKEGIAINTVEILEIKQQLMYQAISSYSATTSYSEYKFNLPPIEIRWCSSPNLT